jgi:hypothetical protein
MSSTITERRATTIEELLARLVAFEPTTVSVLSVYLNTRPDQHGPRARNSPERHSFDRDVEETIAYVTDKIDSAANWLAIFAWPGAEELFEATELTTPLSDNGVYAYNQPNLLSSGLHPWAVPAVRAAVLTDTNIARIFVFGLGHVISARKWKERKSIELSGFTVARHGSRTPTYGREIATQGCVVIPEVGYVPEVRRLNDKVEKDTPKFDWVTERARCSLPNVFRALRLQVEEDVRTRNALRPNNSPYAFSVAENGDDFTVLLEAGEVRRQIVFSLAEHAILVRDDKGEPAFEVTLTFNDQGECKLNVNKQERDFWQVRRMALEELLFRHN